MEIERIVPLSLIILSGFSVAVADALIKRISLTNKDLIYVMQSPWMLLIGVIYIFAIVIFAFSFLRKWDLGIVGLLQIIVYAVAVILLGIVFFHEKITVTHGIGMGLALIAAVLMNI